MPSSQTIMLKINLQRINLNKFQQISVHARKDVISTNAKNTSFH